MNGQTQNFASSSARAERGERGYSVLELLIVLLMIVSVSAFSVIKVVSGKQAMHLSNTTREFAAHLEKARIDSVRRHAGVGAMATVTVNGTTSYTVTMDFDGDGILDAGETRTITFPPSDVSFTGTLPATIRFDWRGRTVDAAGALTSVAALGLQDGYGHNDTVRISGSGDIAINDNPIPTTPSTSSTGATLSNKNINASVKVP